MKTFVPDYWGGFACSASRCRHTCCVDWEIDVDGETMEKYRRADGEFGEKLRRSIDPGKNCFRLTAEERCPFLDSDGLCEIYTRLGKESLCQICADHPRFRVPWSDREEMGLGLCCEEAARLILNRNGPMRWTEAGGDDTPAREPEGDEKNVRDLRDGALALIARYGSGGRGCIRECEEELLRFCGAEALNDACSPGRFPALSGELEILDPEWRELTALIPPEGQDGPEPVPEPGDGPYLRLLEYFVFRHGSMGADPADFAARCAFAVFSRRVIGSMWAGLRQSRDGCGMAELEDVARRYSAEIEYSEDNTAALIGLFEAE